jgi:hypothetical protein
LTFPYLDPLWPRDHTQKQGALNQMIKTMKKSLVLAAAIAALSAIAVPSMASAANWAPVGGAAHALVGGGSINIFVLPSSGAGISCSGQTFSANVTSTAVLTITSAPNFSCTGSGGFSGCNVAAAPTGLPWTANGPTTSNVTINSVNINLTFTAAPGKTCASSGLKTLTGTLAGGVWNNTTHSVGYTNATGLTLTSGGFPFATSLTSSSLMQDNVNPFITLS